MASVTLFYDKAAHKVCLQFSNHAGENARRRLPFVIAPTEWDKERKQVINHPCRAQYNLSIQGVLNNARSVLLRIVQEQPTKHLSSADLRDMVCKVVFNEDSAAPRTFGHIYDEYAGRYNNRTRELYDTTKRQIIAFDKHSLSLPIDDINYGWVQRFSEWSLGRQQRNTLNIRLRCIRAVFNYAIDMEYTTAYPFRKVKIKNEDVLHTELSPEQLRQFWSGMSRPSYKRGRILPASSSTSSA